jgi:HD-GYP domain-containing protein (c-di-GMP phosphodiesterase class II)
VESSVDAADRTSSEPSAERDRLARRLAEAEERISSLNRIGIALSAERDVERLLERILSESRRFTRSEAASLYLAEDGPSGRRLRFRLAQNEAIRVAFAERTVAVTESSLAGFVALRREPLVLEDAYLIPKDAPYRHNDVFDVETGWRTRAVLVVPMCDHAGALVGVLQLMNRRDPTGEGFEAYPADLVPIVLSLATQAAVCLQASRLTEGIRKLFEDFARASIFAVEQRDPTTAGHSTRVAGLTESLARLVDRADEGPYHDVRFSPEEMREIRTAALLHDFGKITVPERVLVKARKLDDETIARIRDRFDLALESLDSAASRELLERMAAARVAPTAEDLRLLDAERLARARELEEQFGEILRANEPTILPRESGGRLRALLTRTWKDRRGATSPLLREEEFVLLSISRGSLSAEERGRIESHVLETYRFLSSIPWTPDLRRIPEIAYAHHEKLDGSGYPRRLRSGEIAVPARVMTICDIYDALTASDRPYKKALSREASLSILEDEARQGLLDPWLVRAFIDEKIWASGGAV